MKKLLWVGDAGVPSGFARATHEVLATLCKSFKVTVLGMHYRGDPYEYPYGIWSAAAGGDVYGVGRLLWMCDREKPDVIVIQNDGWNIPHYVKQLAKAPEYAKIPVVAVVPVDGKNFKGAWLDGVSLTVFWSQFALEEARAGGYVGEAVVIPLGVDLQTYYPMDKYEARLQRKLPREMDDAFIVGNVNRNQPRKRWDLTMKYFADWINGKQIRDAWLYLHMAPTGDADIDVVQLGRYYGVSDRCVLMEPAVFYGLDEVQMRATYNSFDISISTTQGEGFGLTALEAMACRVPCVLPDWSALGEWAKRGAWMVPCTSTAIGMPYVNVIGGIADEAKFIMAMDRLYRDKKAREQNAQAALECAQQPRFRWDYIGQQYRTAISSVLGDSVEEVWQDLGRPQEATA